MALVELRNLTKIYPLGESPFGGGARGEIRAVDNISLDIAAGETLGLVGESGSGKSTLGRLILRLIDPTSGSIRFDGHDLVSASRGAMRRLRRDMQIIFQDPFGSLDPRMRVEAIIAEPMIIHRENGSRGNMPREHTGGHDFERPGGHDFSRAATGEKKLALAAAGHRQSGLKTRVAELLRAVGLDESALPRFPHEFSGGQRQRIVIARALALRPRFIVADEPVSALDVSVGAQIVNLLVQLQREFGLTYLFISHSMPVVRYLATRIAVMYRGKLVEVGNTDEITGHPKDPYTRNLLAATPEISDSPSPMDNDSRS